jgi:putative nucleotidyltransferase with HDIG domain
VSIAAEALIRNKRNIEAEDIFTPALLHDIGKLVLGHFIKDDLEAIENITAKGISYVVAENMILGTDHAQVGAQILAQWSFPPDVIDAVRWHHDPDLSDRSSIPTDIVYLANFLCQMNSTSSENEGHNVEISPFLIERMGIDIREFEEIADKTAQWVDELSDALTFN